MDFDWTVVLGQPVETREANIRCLIPSLPQAATIIQSLAGLAAKLAVVVAAGAGLYVAYQYTDVKGVSNWTTSAASSDSKAIGNEPAEGSNGGPQSTLVGGFSAAGFVSKGLRVLRANRMPHRSARGRSGATVRLPHSATPSSG